jgi:hypothetical protein
MANKVKCPECDWCGVDEELQKAEHPFAESSMHGVINYIYGCPECDHAMEGFPYCCEEEGCWKESTCRTPFNGRYYSTCYEHIPQKLTAECGEGKNE